MSASKLSPSFVTVTDLLHLNFGLRAGTSKNGLLLVHNAHLPEAYEFKVADKRLYQKFFIAHAVRMIGFEELSLEDGIARSRWNFFYSGMKDRETDIDIICSGLKNTLQKNGTPVQADIARNVVFSMRAVLYRLRDVSTSYADQAACAVAQKVKPGLTFGNQDTLNVFLNIHSFLVEAGTLRDQLAIFLNEMLFPDAKADSMAGLVRYLKKTSAELPIGKEIIEICDGESSMGWLARLSSLRNLVVHRAPIVSFGGSMAMRARICAIENVNFMGVTFEVPEDPLLAPAGPKVDALEQCATIARNMIDLFRTVISASGVVPELPHFTDKDFR